MSASAARAAYAERAAKAPTSVCNRFRWYSGCLDCAPKVLAVDSASIDIDNIQATERPYRGPNINLLKDTTPQ